MFKKKKKIKNMNNKMGINTCPSTAGSKKPKINEQEQKWTHRYRGRFNGCQMEAGKGGWVKKVKGLKSTNW